MKDASTQTEISDYWRIKKRQAEQRRAEEAMRLQKSGAALISSDQIKKNP